MTAAAADRFGDRLAVLDGDERLTYAELLHEARTFGAGLVAAGVEPGDRVAIWAPNSARWIVAVLGLFQAGAVLVPVNTRFKGAEAVEILRRSDARALVTVTDFLGTDYVAMLRATGVELPGLATVVVAAGPTPDGTEDWDDVHRPRHRRGAGRGRTARRRRRPRRPVRHPLHLRHHRRAQGRRADPRAHAAGGHRLGGHDRSHRRRPLPDGEPVLPHVRSEGRHPGVRRRRRDHAPRAGLRSRPGAGAGGGRAGHRAPRRADALPVDPRPPRPRPLRPDRACGSRSPARPTSRSS